MIRERSTEGIDGLSNLILLVWGGRRGGCGWDGWDVLGGILGGAVFGEGEGVTGERRGGRSIWGGEGGRGRTRRST
ncbi:predicted protein [Sclerotinia sclerotiorum 1980 UF-70]|uniref:Uncharacterized protein n=1 Tax=Sclerotinia sclerotiorum (strain ATCC 18683 / 1980 / Ss-1) TaxID=665079 RepID=A7F6W3_SCLS1|nr:predicted protein [Sclerotinia sclerotiorum 1980 UF-70]EDN98484.1 predicted protein [Sclerotinia sclerotiorum 1980 UF-70]